MNQAQLWGARFSKTMSEELFKLSQSTSFDWRLAPYDLIQTRAHLVGLVDAGILKMSEKKKLEQAIFDLVKDIKNGKVLPDPKDEDVHSALERILVSKIGDLGNKVRSGRSRNDQISTDLRMYLRDQARSITQELLALITVLIDLGKKHRLDPMPGYTHTQRAQPISLGHLFLSHAQSIMRDLDRIRDWDKRCDVSPLGAGAIAGSGIVKNSNKISKLMGFSQVSTNSIDAVSERDFVAELLFVLALVGTHLSKIAEEIILFTSTEFGYAKIDDAWGTGSSMMPQKKNADGAELTRGKTGRLIGNLTSVLITLKALPFAYNRDLQEDKEPIFDSIDTMFLVIPNIAGLLRTLTFDTNKMSQDAKTGFTLATEIADFLTLKGIDFKTAHEIAGSCVKLAEKLGKELDELTLAQYQQIHKSFDQEIFKVLDVAGSINNRTSNSGTSAKSILVQLKELEGKQKQFKSWSSKNLFEKMINA